MKRHFHLLSAFIITLGGILYAQNPTHLNIFSKDQVSRTHITSIPLDEISEISFIERVDSLPEDSVALLQNPNILPVSLDSVPTDTIPTDTIPSDTIPTDTIPNDTISNDTIPNDTIPNDSVSNLPGLGKKRYETMKVSLKRDSIPLLIVPDSTHSFMFGTNVPLVRIFTDSIVKEISSKEVYLPGYLDFNGYGVYPDLDSVAVSIRGRGNSSWLKPKKPYRLKFDKKQSPADLAAAKSFVLIANYIDPTHSRNAMALRLAQMLGIPFTNHSVPVNVELNGIKKGAYMLSEKIGIGKGSVNIDETTGILWELDTNYDEDYKFYSDIYEIPVMLSDPDPLDLFPDSIAQIETWFADWQEDYNVMEENIFRGHPENVIDLDQLSRYLLVNLVCGNHELTWPKSVKLYKENKDSLYKFGPVWDFDWGLGYAFLPDRVLFTKDWMLKGTYLFTDIVRSTSFMDKFGEIWEEFKTEIYPAWLEYLDEYAETVRLSAMQDRDLWPEGAGATTEFDEEITKMRSWIQERVELIDTHPHYLFY